MKLIISAILALSFGSAANAAVYNNPGYATTLAMELGTNTVTNTSTGSCQDTLFFLCSESNLLRFAISLGNGMTLTDIDFEVTAFSGTAPQDIRYKSYDTNFSATFGSLTSLTSIDFFTGTYDGQATTNHFSSFYSEPDGAQDGDAFTYSSKWTFTVIETPQQDAGPESVPAPAALGFIGFGLLGLGLRRRRQRG